MVDRSPPAQVGLTRAEWTVDVMVWPEGWEQVLGGFRGRVGHRREGVEWAEEELDCPREPSAWLS